MKSNAELHLRDPMVLVWQDRYYLYGTEIPRRDHQPILSVYVGKDLQKWEGPYPLCDASCGELCGSISAPEVHIYQNRFYLFGQIRVERFSYRLLLLSASDPAGPFRLHAHICLPDETESALDGTFLLSPDGMPYEIYAHNWTKDGNGALKVFRLSADLRRRISEPFLLFRGTDIPWNTVLQVEHHRGYVCEAPWMMKAETEGFVLLFSAFSKNGYAVGAATAAALTGPWTIGNAPIYNQNGGHCSTFLDLHGVMKMALHAPNLPPNERPVFLPFHNMME